MQGSWALHQVVLAAGTPVLTVKLSKERVATAWHSCLFPVSLVLLRRKLKRLGGQVTRGLVILAIIYRVLLGSFWEWADFQPWLDMGWPLLGSNYPLQWR